MAAVPDDSGGERDGSANACTPFPVCDLMPKRETQLADFLARQPEYDGRGIKICILDSGVDPAAPGLQVTSTGERKLIEVMDGSGAGDVDTSTVRRTPSTVDNAAGHFVVDSLTGRPLKVPTEWAADNPSGRWHVGAKPLFELFGLCAQRVKTERKEQRWDASQRLALADAMRQLADADDGPTVETLVGKWRRENLVAQVDFLKTLDADFKDAGPLLDCITWYDGKSWRVCLDTTYRGNLSKCQVLRPFRENGDYGRLSKSDMSTYVVNVHDNGKLVEICCTHSYHGTHVAGIAAACHPDAPEMNGAAPGAQLVSCHVSDARTQGHSMETGTAFARAINRCIDLGVDVINYSFGEGACMESVGRIVTYLSTCVHKYGILFVTSAGNSGPALGTVGAPATATECCMSVGAWLSPRMMQTLYSAETGRDRLPPPMGFPWTSQGPTSAGARGVSVAGPGAAITSMPKWTLESASLKNGTSMASPNVAGCIACLMCALRAEKIGYSPMSIASYVENSAKPFGDSPLNRLSLGAGVIQVSSALSYARRHWQRVHVAGQTGYAVRCVLKGAGVRLPATLAGVLGAHNGARPMRGIYVREPFEHALGRQLSYDVSVAPKWAESADNEVKADFMRNVALSCDADWVQAPKLLCLTNSPRNFTVHVNVNMLDVGVHYTELVAIDTERPDAGALFYVPVTVIVPESIQPDPSLTDPYTLTKTGISLGPGQNHRCFVAVPTTANWVVISLRHEPKADRDVIYILHAMQLLPDMKYASTEAYKRVGLPADGAESRQAFAVTGGRTLELCLTKWWTSFGASALTVKIEFHSLQPTTGVIEMGHHECVHKVDVRADLRAEEVAPTVTLKNYCQIYRPSEATLSPLGPRDLVLDLRQIHSLLLQYEFDLAKPNEIVQRRAQRAPLS